MAEAKNKFVPIDQVNSPRLRVALKLPAFIPTDQIGVNVGKITWLCNIAGIDHLRVESVNQGTSSFVPVVVGMNEQGSAVAGKVGLKTEVKTFSTEADSPEDGIDDFEDEDDTEHPKRWTNAKVSLNIDEVTHQIQQDPNISGGLRSLESWANILDQSIKQCLLTEGTRHLLLGLRARDWRSAAYYWGIAAIVSTDIIPLPSLSSTPRVPHIPTLEEFAIQLVIQSTFVNVVDYLRSRSQPGNPYRLSLFVGPQFDRALILNTIGRLGKVASATSLG